MKTMIMIFALSLCSVCANPEGDKFRKFGMYESSYITQGNADSFHLAEDCPINNERKNENPQNNK